MRRRSVAVRSRGAAGFTLIELMIVVAIIGILAAVAIPNFVRFQMRSKAAEGKTNVASIRTAQESHFAEYSTYVACSSSPGGVNNFKRAWTDQGGYVELGFEPEGDVFFSYGVAVGPSGGPPFDHYTAEGVSDLDGDGQLAAVAYVKASPTGTAVAGNTAGDASVDCPSTGVWEPQTGARMVDAFGPCMPDFLQGTF